jgi:hypothetical protein
MNNRLIEQLERELKIKDQQIANLQEQVKTLMEHLNNKHLFFKVRKQPVAKSESKTHNLNDFGVRKKKA